MSEVQFQEDFNKAEVYQSLGYDVNGESKGMAGFLLRKGFVKDEATANKALLIMSVLFFASALFVIFRYLV